MTTDSKPINPILIIDDDPEICQNLKEMISEHAHAVILPSAEEALDYLKTEASDIIITDYILSGLNGLELLDLLKEKYPEKIVILMTGFGDMSVTITALQKGAFDFLVKPFREDAIIGAIKRAASNIALKQQLKKDRDAYVQELIHKSKLASIGTMASEVAHELNNPLTCIKGFVELITHPLNDQQANKKEQFYQKTMKCIKRMELTVNHLRSYVKNETIKDWCRINLKQTLDNAFMMTDWKLIKSKVQYQLTAAENIWIFGSQNKIESVIQNLIVNSCDAYLENLELQNPRAIQITVTQEGHLAVLKYEDFAGGIKESAVSNIFEPFFTTKKRGIGSGIGMSLVKNIVEEHKGQINLVNKPGSGVTFTISIPMA